MTTTVRNDTNRGRYELIEDERVVGIADYRIDGDVIVFPHTEIDRSRRGQGLGAVLVQAALDDARVSGYRVVPACWYVAQFIDEHPAYADLLAA